MMAFIPVLLPLAPPGDGEASSSCPPPTWVNRLSPRSKQGSTPSSLISLNRVITKPKLLSPRSRPLKIDSPQDKKKSSINEDAELEAPSSTKGVAPAIEEVLAGELAGI